MNLPAFIGEGIVIDMPPYFVVPNRDKPELKRISDSLARKARKLKTRNEYPNVEILIKNTLEA